LTPREVLFVASYFATGNAAQAYRLAGYRAKNGNVAGVCGHRLLKRAKVRDAIARHRAELSARASIDGAWVLHELVESYHRCTSGDRFDPANALRALENVAKIVGAWS
jgi:phage terminase small subunit